MTTPALDLDHPLRLHPLTYLDEGGEVTAGRADTGSFGLFPADGAALLRHLEAGHPPAEAARWYSEQYGEQVDISEFLGVLDELDLIAPDGEPVAAPAPVRWQRLGTALFSPAAWAAYGVLVTAAAVAMIRQPALVPVYQHLFFTRSSLLILMAGVVAGQLPLILAHEAWHALAGRRLGLNSTLRIGRRFYYVVFVTSLDGLVAVPRRQRYLPMLAGMLLDVLAIAGLTLAAAPLLGATGGAAVAGRVLLSMAFGTVLRLAWQFYFFLRTDLYYLATTILGCNDLQATARQLLANRFWRLARRPGRLADEAAWHPRDARVASWYSWLMAAGYTLLAVMLVTTAFPVGIRLTGLAVHELTSTHSPLRMADALGFLALNFWEPALAAALAIRSFRRTRQRRRTRQPRPARQQGETR
jgi:hypothetical protein